MTLKQLFGENPPSIEELTDSEAIDRIETLNRNLAKFWSSSHGWAPLEAAELLGKSRLDRQVSMSATLRFWLSDDVHELTDGELILAWANLGCLLEGTLKLFLSVWYVDYSNDVNALKKDKKTKDPDGVALGELKQFFSKTDLLSERWITYIGIVQQRRNAIHAFQNKELGSTADVRRSVREYLMLLRMINRRLPYPDEAYVPREA